ncbi:Thermospermine synthase ACAULIS5 [Linum grandiflorum]
MGEAVEMLDVCTTTFPKLINGNHNHIILPTSVFHHQQDDQFLILTTANGNNDTSDDDDDQSSTTAPWYEESIDHYLKWSFAVNRVLQKATSEFQDIALLDTKPFGKALVIDGKMQSAEADEFVYHESLVHPSLLSHPSPRTVFIMGGGEGSTAREALKHKSIHKVVMCDIDKV